MRFYVCLEEGVPQSAGHVEPLEGTLGVLGRADYRRRPRRSYGQVKRFDLMMFAVFPPKGVGYCVTNILREIHTNWFHLFEKSENFIFFVEQ